MAKRALTFSSTPHPVVQVLGNRDIMRAVRRNDFDPLHEALLKAPAFSYGPKEARELWHHVRAVLPGTLNTNPRNYLRRADLAALLIFHGVLQHVPVADRAALIGHLPPLFDRPSSERTRALQEAFHGRLPQLKTHLAAFDSALTRWGDDARAFHRKAKTPEENDWAERTKLALTRGFHYQHVQMDLGFEDPITPD